MIEEKKVKVHAQISKKCSKELKKQAIDHDLNLSDYISMMLERSVSEQKPNKT